MNVPELWGFIKVVGVLVVVSIDALEWTIVTVFLVLFTVGWFFYFLTLKYWKRKGFFEKYTWIGIIALSKRWRNLEQPGRTYARIALFILELTPVLLIIMLLLLMFLGYYD